MPIKRIIEIDPDDELIQSLARVTDYLGLAEMYEVVLSARQLYSKNNQKVAIIITEDTAWDVVRMIMSAAVLNFASWKHPEFEVEFIFEGKKEAVVFTRDHTPEQYMDFANEYFSKAKDLFEKYFPTEDLDN